MILEPPSKSQMDVLNVASQTVIKSLLSFFEEIGMMGRNIEYPPTFEGDGLAGYRTYFEDDWKEFKFRRSVRYTIPNVRQTVQELAQKKNLIENPSYPSHPYDKNSVFKQVADLVKKTDNPILLIQTQPDYVWGFYYDPKISFIGEFKDEGDNSYYLEVSHAVKFAISLNRPNSIYIKTPRIYNRCFDNSSFNKIFRNSETVNPPTKLLYISDRTQYNLYNQWNSYKTKIFQGFRNTDANAMFLYMLGPKPISLINWNSVPWDNNFK